MHYILLNNRISLLFLLGAVAYSVMTAGNMAAVVTLLLSISIVFLVKTSQEKDGVKYAYLAAFTLSLAAVAWPYVIVLLLAYLCFLIKPLEVFSVRRVMAMLLGALSPLWLYLPLWLYRHVVAMDWQQVQEYYAQLVTQVTCFDYGEVTVMQAVIYGIMLFLFLGLIVRRSAFRYKGKLFVRMQRAVYISMVWIMVLTIIVLPSFADWLLPLMIAFIGPVAAQVAMGDDR